MSMNLVTEISLGPSRNFVTEISLSELGGASKNLVTVISLERWLRNLVTEMSFSSRSLLIAPSSRRKFARAVSMNLVTVISLFSRNLEVEVFRN